MALAGLWENWRSRAGEWIRSFAVITTTPNELCAELDDRMPVVLKPETWPQWLGEEAADPKRLKALLAPYPAEEMVAWPVSPRVGNVKNNDPSLIKPIADMVRLSGSGGPEEAMNWHGWLVTLLVMLALAACAQEGQPPPASSAPQSPENVHDRGFSM